MKKVLLFFVLVLVCVTVFSYTLGVKARYVSINYAGFYRAMQVTYVYPNSIASRFLKVGDFIVAASSAHIYAPDATFSNQIQINGQYIYNVSGYYDFAIHSQQYFLDVVSQMGYQSTVTDFVVYRNGSFILFSLGY